MYAQVIHVDKIGCVHDMHANLYWCTQKNVLPNFQFFKSCSKKHPLCGGLKPPPLPQVMSTLELDGYGWQLKIPFSLALPELVLDDAKVEILLIS